MKQFKSAVEIVISKTFKAEHNNKIKKKISRFKLLHIGCLKTKTYPKRTMYEINDCPPHYSNVKRVENYAFAFFYVCRSIGGSRYKSRFLSPTLFNISDP